MPRSPVSVEYRIRDGRPIVVGDLTVTPRCRALAVRLPFGGYVWNRPVGVLVERDGRVERLPIFDLTRVLQIALFGVSLGFALCAATATRRRKE